MLRGHVTLAGLAVVEGQVALAERAAARILAAEAHGRAFERQRAERQRLPGGPIQIAALGPRPARRLLVGVASASWPRRRTPVPSSASVPNASASPKAQSRLPPLAIASRRFSTKPRSLGDRKSTRLNSSHLGISYA